jgi:hypothetical protein
MILANLMIIFYIAPLMGFFLIIFQTTKPCNHARGCRASMLYLVGRQIPAEGAANRLLVPYALHLWGIYNKKNNGKKT